MVMQLVPVMMVEVAEEKEPLITNGRAISALKQHMVKEPIFEAGSSRTEEFLSSATGTTRD
jgi:hypothetical protein